MKNHPTWHCRTELKAWAVCGDSLRCLLPLLDLDVPTMDFREKLARQALIDLMFEEDRRILQALSACIPQPKFPDRFWVLAEDHLHLRL